MENAIQLSQQYADLSLQLAQMLQTVWQFTAFMTLGAIGWGLASGQNERAPSVLARILVGLGLMVFYALNVYVLWNLMQRLHAAESLAKRYSTLVAGRENPEIDVVFQQLPDLLLIGTAGIGAVVVVIVFILMGPMGRRARIV